MLTATRSQLTTAVPAPPLDPAAPASSVKRLALLASIVIAFLAASSAPTPLYEHYDAIWHGTALTTTIAFGIYAVAVLAGLLSLGQLAAHVGRRRVLLGALALQMVAMLLFATAGSFTPLLIGRVVQGLATGAALGALSAAMIESHRRHGTLTSAAAPAAGTGLGALLAAVVVDFLPWPTHLIYLLLMAAFALQAFGVVRLIDSAPWRPVPLSSLRPQIAIPTVARGVFVTTAPVLFAVWSLAGFYGSLGPALSRQLAGSDSVVLGGVGLFVLAGMASLATIVLRRVSPRGLMAIGVATLVTGIASTILTIHIDSAAGYFAATALAGIGFGTGFQGAIRSLTVLAQPTQRAGLLSAAFVVSYIGLGLPAVLAGYLVSRGHSLTGVAVGYGVVLIALALIAGAGLLRRPVQPAEA